MQDQHNLKPNTILNNYKIIRVLGEGSFGITYLAKDSSLNLEVVIKEYFPNEFAMRSGDSSITAKSKYVGDFSIGKQRFKEEAQMLARFSHPSIVKILGYFETNDTAYFVMEYEEGKDLSRYIKEKGTPLGQEEILSIIMPILEGLKEVHAHNYLHRDIKPGNIFLRSNKSPVLIDFGASKLAIGEASKSITSMLTEGYAPLEQYSTDIKQQGQFTDIYAISAVMYKMITGEVPPSAQTRSYQLLQDDTDPYESLMTIKLSGYDKNFLRAIDRALSMKAKDRPQNVQEFQEDIAGKLLQKENLLKEIPKRKKKNSNTFAMILVAFIVVVLGVFGYLLYSDHQKAEKEQRIQKKIDDKRKQNEIEQKKIIEANKKRFDEIQKRKKEKAENSRLAALELEKDKQRKRELERKKKLEAKKVRLVELEKEKKRKEELAEYKLMEEKRKKEEELRKLESQKFSSLTINVDPIDASVKILNIKPKYYDGIKLKKGKYKIRVSRKGYKSKTVIIKLKSKIDEYNISLTKIDNKNNANQIIPNKQFISYTKSCEDSDFSACDNLGLMYQSGKNLKKNASGQMYATGKVIIRKNTSRAYKLYQKACNGGYAPGCYSLGSMYKFGDGVTKNVLKAMKLYKKASDGGSCHGDASLGNIYEEGKIVKKNMSKALRLYTQSCKRGCGRGCMHVQWIEVGKQNVVGNAHNCELGAIGIEFCNLSGEDYENGKYIAKDKLKALKLYKKACNGGSADGCKNYKRLHNK